VRAVLDPNVIISGLLSAGSAPAETLTALDRGEFELIASEALLDELGRALAYPKLRSRIGADDGAAVVRWLGQTATLVPDTEADTPVRSSDPDDDYLIALASVHRAALVSGDKHLLGLVGEIPVFSPREFLALLAGPGAQPSSSASPMRSPPGPRM
jgi:putative PIN family toxin of toxin-antitoxin system